MQSDERLKSIRRHISYIKTHLGELPKDHKAEALIKVANLGSECQQELYESEPRYETLYECWDEHGVAVILNKNGHAPHFNRKKFGTHRDAQSLKRKTGRTLKLNLDTWEVE